MGRDQRGRAARRRHRHPGQRAGPHARAEVQPVRAVLHHQNPGDRTRHGHRQRHVIDAHEGVIAAGTDDGPPGTTIIITLPRRL